MSGIRTVAHAPRCPAEHARLGCSARVRGLPPPAAVRCSASLRAHSRGDPPLRRARYVVNGSAHSARSHPRWFGEVQGE